MKKRKPDFYINTVDGTNKKLTEEELSALIADARYDRRRLLNAMRKTQDEMFVENQYEAFLVAYPPEVIEKQLNERVIGQPDLTKNVADFLFYHMLRHIYPDLPPRPMLISGPSGCGKTEVWRAVSELYGDFFDIVVADGSRITEEGWKGNYKLSNIITEDLADSGILIIDEFDKCAKPEYSNGVNVGQCLQAEFLKVLEGEYYLIKDDEPIIRNGDYVYTTTMGMVFAGAFDDIRIKKGEEQLRRGIGFGKSANEGQGSDDYMMITEEDLLDFGIMPEIVGRLATKCCVKQLSDENYLTIVKNEHSRVSKIANILKKLGVETSNVLTDDMILSLIRQSKHNNTGVRWVSSQVESVLLDEIRKQWANFSLRKKNEASDGENVSTETKKANTLTNGWL